MTKPPSPKTTANRVITFLLILAGLLIIAGFLWSTYQQRYPPPQAVSLPQPAAFPSSSEERLWRFLAANMSDGRGGIYTNLLASPTSVQDDLASGHAVLSESVGLLMEYAVQSGDKGLFDLETKLLRDQFLQDDFIRWLVAPAKLAETSNVNSVIDDLRIIGALLAGADQFQEPDSKTLALQLAKGLRRYNEDSGWLYDFASAKTGERAKTVQVRYADLQTLQALAKEDSSYQPLCNNARALLEKAQQPSGLFAAAYFPKTQQFQTDSKTHTAAIPPNMSEQLVAALHAQAGGLPTANMQNLLRAFLRDTKKIPATVTADGKPASQTESPAVYALATQLFLRAGDAELAKQCLSLLRGLQVSPANKGNATSDQQKKAQAYNGGFVDLQTLQAYSFDQLEALLALREAGKAGVLTR